MFTLVDDSAREPVEWLLFLSQLCAVLCRVDSALRLPRSLLQLKPFTSHFHRCIAVISPLSLPCSAPAPWLQIAMLFASPLVACVR